MNSPTRELEGGLVLRSAADRDAEQVLALESATFGVSDVAAVAAHLSGPDAELSDWSVVLDGDRIVAASTLLYKRVLFDEVEFSAGEIEFVATAPDFRRRGLVRAQFDWHHERSANLGHLAQFVAGIPYLYRKFGYGYGVSYADLFTFDRAVIEPPVDVTLRNVVESDLPSLARLESLRSTRGLRFARDDLGWRRRIQISGSATEKGLQRGAERFYIAERDGKAVGWSGLSVESDPKHLLVLPGLADDSAVADAIIAHAIDQAPESFVVIGHDTPGTEYGRRVRELGSPSPYGLGIFVRIPDPVSFLKTIRAVLTRRLSESSFANTSGEVDISLYSSGVKIEYQRGVVTDIKSIPGLEDPFDARECGVAPDWLPALVLGRFGARQLAARVDDVFLGRNEELLEALFPRMESDIVGDF